VLGASLRPAILGRNIATLDPAEFAQSLHKGADPTAVERRRVRAQEPDGRQLRRLLRPRRKRPRRHRTAEQRDELAPVLTELHAIPHAERAPHLQDIELAAISQRLVELFRTRQLLANAVGVREGCSPDDPLVVPSTEIPSARVPRRGFALGAEFAAITRPG
jgi:hypothetical protein